MQEMELSYNGRKTLCVQMGDEAGREISDLLQALINRVQHLEKTKVDVMPIVPLRRTARPTPFQEVA